MIRVLFSFVAVCLCLSSTVRAQADTINLFAGSSVVYGPGLNAFATVHFVGDRGFTFDGGTEAALGTLVPADCAVPSNDCNPGKTLSLTAAASDADLPGHATLDGVSYPVVGAAPADAAYEFTGTVTLPPFGQSPTASVTVPVDFSGFFQVDQVGGNGLSNQLIASASATLMLQQGTTGLGIPAWLYRGIRYDLVPVPEPTTLALVGTALAVVGAGAVVQRRNKHNGPGTQSRGSRPCRNLSHVHGSASGGAPAHACRRFWSAGPLS